MSIGSIHINFGKKWESNSELFLCKFRNLCFVPRFLTHELIARESENFEALTSVLLRMKGEEKKKKLNKIK